MRTALALVLMLVGGCTANSYAHRNFDMAEPVIYRDASNNEYTIRDKPVESRLKMLMGLGGTAALLVGGRNAVPPMPLWEEAAISWLATTGRTCTVARSFEIIMGEVEIQYTCA